jgi:hypothetical protein
MAQPEHTPQLALLEEAIIVLFCRVDDVYHQLNPKGGGYASLKRLSDSERYSPLRSSSSSEE